MRLFTCPNCGSERIRVSRRKKRWRPVRRLLGIHSLRCDYCGHQFDGSSLRWRYVWYAKCPLCACLELTDWEEKYHFPPFRKRVLLYFGGREQRCERCRCNFVSFRRRWKRKKNGSK